jgi:hypothetical protein
MQMNDSQRSTIHKTLQGVRSLVEIPKNDATEKSLTRAGMTTSLTAVSDNAHFPIFWSFQSESNVSDSSDVQLAKQHSLVTSIKDGI